MRLRDYVWLRVSGIAGIITPIVAVTCILLAIVYYPPFSWTENALSDLGVKEAPISTLFNYGVIVSGISGLVFAFGLFRLVNQRMEGKIGSTFFIIAALALIGIGVFNENFRPIHRYVSVAFFAAMPLSMLFLVVAFLKKGEKRMCLFTSVTIFVATVVWAFQWTLGFGQGVAIPEMLSATSFSIWSLVLSVNMIKQTS
jgi:hypothetical membrane protein